MSAYDVVEPASIGLDEDACAALVDRARREVDDGLLPSCQLAVAREGKVGLFATLGDATDDTRYTIFSCTKGLIAGLIYQLLGDGSLKLDQRVADVIPEFGSNDKDVITVEMVLLHMGGFPSAPLGLLNGEAADRAARIRRFASWRCNWEPGTRYEYHPTSGHWVLAELIERVTGTDYRDVLRKRVLDPLGLSRLQLGVPVEQQSNIADLAIRGTVPTPEEIEAIIGVPLDLEALVGQVTSDALMEFNDPGVRALGVPGGGGVASAADLALYYQGLLHDPLGMWPADRLAWATEVRCDLPDPIRGNPAHRSLGLQVAGSPPDAQMRGFGYGQSPRSFGHDGAAGQIAWVDPDSGLSFCYLTNGIDQHVIREGRRRIGLSSRAAACAPTDS